ncbi:helix-turn-helix transcriptional regulator [Arthrobacter sp.]|uniref:helix-turn-helix transcriptional regulator n=1 Tax=Arthrobacter sp. TaxID=1667 RepID=UPI003A8CDB4C
MQDSKEFLTSEDLAKRYSVSIDTIRHWRKTSTGPRGLKLGRHVRYPMESVLAFEASRAEAPREGSSK